MSDYYGIEHRKQGNPYPAIYREREVMRETLALAGAEATVRQVAEREFMWYARAFDRSWQRVQPDAPSPLERSL